MALLACMIASGCAKEGDVYVYLGTDAGPTNTAGGAGPGASGSDPELDSDGDGIPDAEEEELGLDPDVPDTDYDGYTDAEELHAGTDPLNPNDLIYVGGWSYNMNKDAIEGEPLSSVIDVGEVLGRFKGVDQFDDLVDLYDFADGGAPVLLHYSRVTTSTCYTVGWWADSYDQYVLNEPDGPLVDWPGVSGAIAAGEVRWVTVISDYDDEWLVKAYADYLDDRPQVVMYDATGELRQHLGLGETECGLVLTDEKMRVLAYDPDDVIAAVRFADSLL